MNSLRQRLFRMVSVAALSLTIFSFASTCLGFPQLLSPSDPTVPLPAGANGDSISPSLSPDGRFVLFSSLANNLVTNDNGYLRLDVFLRDRGSNSTVLISPNFRGNGGGNGNSLAGNISTNGRYAVFQSDAGDLLPGDTNGVTDIFVRDTQLATNLLVSVAADGSWGNGPSTSPIMTPRMAAGWPPSVPPPISFRTSPTEYPTSTFVIW